MPFIGTCVELKVIILSEIIQSYNGKFMYFLLYVEFRRIKDMIVKETRSDVEEENWIREW
jgi:hypothetical protein